MSIMRHDAELKLLRREVDALRKELGAVQKSVEALIAEEIEKADPAPKRGRKPKEKAE